MCVEVEVGPVEADLDGRAELAAAGACRAVLGNGAAYQRPSSQSRKLKGLLIRVVAGALDGGFGDVGVGARLRLAVMTARPHGTHAWGLLMTLLSSRVGHQRSLMDTGAWCVWCVWCVSWLQPPTTTRHMPRRSAMEEAPESSALATVFLAA
jgi:hypothetical protein